MSPSFWRLSFRATLTVVILAAAGVVAVVVGFAGDADVEVARLVEFLDLEPGQTIAEVGAGTGWLTVEIAQRVGPTGHVYATELSESRRADIEQAVAEASLNNVTVIAAGEDTTHLTAHCCDAVFMRRVYHHLSDSAHINESLHAAIKPGGRLAIIEFRDDGWLGWITGMGIAPTQLVEEVSAAGFSHVETADWPGRRHYIVLFERL